MDRTFTDTKLSIQDLVSIYLTSTQKMAVGSDHQSLK